MENYPICNHRKETAPVIFGKVFILCWRCTGVMLSFFIMGMIRFINAVKLGNVQALIGVGAVLPMIIDGISQYFFNKESTNKKRFITGFLFGLGASFLVFIWY